MRLIERNNFFLLLLIIASYFASCWYVINLGSIWKDEKLSLLCATGIYELIDTGKIFTQDHFWQLNTIPHAIEITKKLNGGNNLLHTLIGFYWTNIFGLHDISLKALSLFFGLLCCLLFYYWIISCRFNLSHAAIAVLLFAFNPIVFAYSIEFRAYTQALFFTLAATMLLFVLIEKNTWWHYLLYALCAAASFLSHYASVYILLFHIVIFLLYARRAEQYRRIILAAIVAAFPVAVWLWQGGLEAMQVFESVNEIYRRRAMQNTGNDNFALPATAVNIITGWFQMLLPMFCNGLQNVGLRIRHIALLIVIPLYFVVWAKKYFDTEPRKYFSMALLSLSALIFATITALQSGHIIPFQPHYAIFSIPYTITMLFAGILQSMKAVSKRVASVFFLFILGGIMLISLLPFFSPKNQKAPDNPYFRFALLITQTYHPSDTVVYSSSEDALFTNVYLKEAAPIVQTIDSSLEDGKVMIKKSGQIAHTIFDFTGKRF